MLTHRKPASDWYKTAFQFDYLRVYPHRNDEEARKQVDFLLERLVDTHKWDVLDIGCGDGRHSLELTRRGYRVTGLDLSEELLGRARLRAEDEQLDINFIQGDMREVRAVSSFDLVVNFFTSFGYFNEDYENARVLDAIARSLRPGGHFLIDYLNRSYVLATLIPEDRRNVDGMDVQQRRWITGDPAKKHNHVRINKHVQIREGGVERSYDESVRMYTLDELASMMDQAGLKVMQAYGDFEGAPISDDTPRNILIGTLKSHAGVEPSGGNSTISCP
tara:strand:- start:397 stop:1224 length:828 start_codon:yes stop_codon:yes gene_type:complete